MATQRTVRVMLGDAANQVGTLSYTRDGAREHSSFAYDPAWLTHADTFGFSPDLPLVTGHQYHKAPTKDDSVFHYAFADTEPDGWGCRVIARDHAKRRKAAQAGGLPAPSAALTEMDYLLGVDDLSRIGALRLADENGNFLRAVEPGGRGTPPLLELPLLMAASHAVELNKETEADLRYLRGRGTSLGGLRPKCTVVDADGHLAIGKFPSVQDDRSVTRGEVLALHLARAAGINTADSRIVMSGDLPVALIRRFDRVASGKRIPYLSAGSLAQVGRQDEHTYAQIADAIIVMGAQVKLDLEELWRRMVFNLLSTNVDDHMHNHGFLHVAHGQWRLAPAFDVNPFPDKDQELKLWLTPDSGPVSSINEVVANAGYFHLSDSAALRVLEEVVQAVLNWRVVAQSASVGMTRRDLEDFAPAFEHAQLEEARQRLRL